MPDYIKEYLACQEVDFNGEPIGLPEREIRRFDWKSRRRDALYLADLYRALEMPDYALRAATCGTYLGFAGGETPLGAVAPEALTLKMANFCQLRLCPVCTARKARKMAGQLSRVLNKVEADHPGCRFLFLTLTVENVFGGEELDGSLRALHAGWRRLLDLRRWERAIRGWYRADEITRNNEWGKPWYGSYHPHIHAILAVEAEYFQSLKYMQQSELVQMWRKAMRLHYNPGVDIRATYDKRSIADTDKASITATYEASKRPVKEWNYISSSSAAAAEAAKYTVKSVDFLHGKGPHKMTWDEQLQVVKDYTFALRRKRMTAVGGWLKDAAVQLRLALEDDNDLIHLGDEEELREDIALYLYSYRWSFGVGDYILTDVRPYELKVE